MKVDWRHTGKAQELAQLSRRYLVGVHVDDVRNTRSTDAARPTWKILLPMSTARHKRQGRGWVAQGSPKKRGGEGP
jgi:hypothetical protein